VIIVPSFVLLIGLVLGGRFDEGAPTVEEQHAPRRGARRPLVTVAGGPLVAGALLTFLDALRQRAMPRGWSPPPHPCSIASAYSHDARSALSSARINAGA
jgi:hypothetical protein